MTHTAEIGADSRGSIMHRPIPTKCYLIYKTLTDHVGLL